MLSRVQVKRIKSDIPACNFNRNDLEIAGSLASGARQLRNSRACRRESALFLDGFSRSMRSFSVPRLRSDTAAQPKGRRNDSFAKSLKPKILVAAQGPALQGN